MTDSLKHLVHGEDSFCGRSAPTEKNLDAQVVPSDRILESAVSWIEQDSTTKPDEYLEDCNTRICGE
jgi:hypothetical protein